MSSPRRPTGTGPEATFMKAVWDELFGPAGKFIDTTTVQWSKTTKGKAAHAKVSKRASSGTGTLNYQGTYDPTKTYSKGDIVRVQTGTSQGTWICVVSGLAAGTAPVFPEPVTTGGVNKWDMWVFGVQASVDCQNGNKTIYINASAPVT